GRGGAAAQQQAAARAGKGAVELLEALAEESKTRRADIWIAGIVIVEDEDRDDALRVARGAGKSGVVVDAKIPSEPVNDRAHAVNSCGRWSGSGCRQRRPRRGTGEGAGPRRANGVRRRRRARGRRARGRGVR